MITRAQMPRQLRNRGGMTVKTVRQKYGLGSLVKKTIRKLIPNELADVAVKAAPFVAPFNPGAAALMRGVGRFDQRGSISDALKQGAATYGFGQAARFAGGAGFQTNFLGTPGDRFTTPFGRETGFGKMFAPTETTKIGIEGSPELPSIKGAPRVTKDETGIVRAITDKTIAKIPGATKLLPKSVMDQLVVGGITSGASALYSYFKGDFRPQEEGETMEEYLAARKESVGKQMRAFMDNYYRFDPEYSAMSDAERDAFVARYNLNQGGIARLNLRKGSGDELPPDPTTPVNPFKPKPIGPVLPNKEMAGYGYNEAMADTYDSYLDMKKKGLIPPTMDFDEFLQEVVPEMSRKKDTSGIMASAILGDESDALAEQLFGKPVKDLNPAEMQELQDEIDRLMNKFRAAKGGITNIPVRTNSEGVKELDYRKTGGFVPIGVKEKADDVPAMLSKNEFVFTADAVRGAGNGSIKKGAQRMYDTMKKLESRVG